MKFTEETGKEQEGKTPEDDNLFNFMINTPEKALLMRCFLSMMQ